MALKSSRYIFILLLLLENKSLFAILANWTRNDPYPLFSSVFTYDYLTEKQKAHLMRFDYAYPCERFRFSISAYRQSASFGRDHDRNAINLGDINGRWNMLGLFWDPVLRDKLFQVLSLDLVFDPVVCNVQPNPPAPNPCWQFGDCKCFCAITDPRKSDPNQEFGFFTIPLLYRKYGVRFESILLLIDKCYYSVGFRAQFGVADIRQTVLDFTDLTCQALGISCPAFMPPENNIEGTCPNPVPQAPPAVTPPFINQADNPIPPCPTTCGAVDNIGVGPTTPIDCVPLAQRFQPCCNQTCCFSFDCNCKRIVLEKIMKQRDLIFEFLGIDACSFHRVGPEDLRLTLFWREIFVINQEDEFYPRLLLMPFIEAGVGVPLDKQIPTFKAFALPSANNGHLSAGLTAGFTLNFLETIELSFAGGFTRFFKRDYCNLRLPTNEKESGIFPYTADVELRPGTTWTFGIGMNAYHFLDNLSFWGEYVFVSHAQDRIKVCRAHIPENSAYFKQGFLVEFAECLSKFEVQYFNAAFNYDLSPNLQVGVLWQAPVKQRNAYRSGTILGTISFIY